MRGRMSTHERVTFTMQMFRPAMNASIACCSHLTASRPCLRSPNRTLTRTLALTLALTLVLTLVLPIDPTQHPNNLHPHSHTHTYSHQVIGFTNNFLFNLYSGVRAAVRADAGASPITARLLIDAAADLQPCVIDTVPWLAEELMQMLERDEASAWPLKKLAYLLAGGAALNEELLLPIVRRHGGCGPSW